MGNITPEKLSRGGEACILEQTVLAMMGRELVSRAWEEVWRLGVRRGISGKAVRVSCAADQRESL